MGRSLQPARQIAYPFSLLVTCKYVQQTPPVITVQFAKIGRSIRARYLCRGAGHFASSCVLLPMATGRVEGEMSRRNAVHYCPSNRERVFETTKFNDR